MNPQSEEETIEETIDSLRGERVVSQQTSLVIEASTSSHREEMERKHNVEVSSTKPQSKHASDIKKNFTEIKARNEPLRAQVYNQYMNMAPTN